MDKKVYLTSDQYVVLQLEKKEEEIEKLNNDISVLSQQLFIEREKNKQLTEIRGLFRLDTTVDGTGSKIVFNNNEDDYAVAYCFTKEYDDNFKALLKLLGL